MDICGPLWLSRDSESLFRWLLCYAVFILRMLHQISVLGSKESIQLRYILQWQPIQNSRDLIWIHMNTLNTNDVPQILQLCHSKGTFRHIHIQGFTTKNTQHNIYVFQMLLQTLTINQYVIKEYQLISQCPIHTTLEGSWYISQAKEHDQEFKVSIVTLERCLLQVILPDPNLMITKSQIYFGEVTGTVQLTYKFLNTGN